MERKWNDGARRCGHCLKSYEKLHHPFFLPVMRCVRKASRSFWTCEDPSGKQSNPSSRPCRYGHMDKTACICTGICSLHCHWYISRVEVGGMNCLLLCNFYQTVVDWFGFVCSFHCFKLKLKALFQIHSTTLFFSEKFNHDFFVVLTFS